MAFSYSQTGYMTGITSGTRMQDPGRTLTFTESALTHPSHTDGFVDVGDVVKVGNIYGVAKTSAAAATDQVAVDVCGSGAVYSLSVMPHDGDANTNIAAGDKIFVSSVCALSVNRSGAFFGIALAAATGAGTATAIPVWLGANPGEGAVDLDPYTQTLTASGAAAVYGTTYLDSTAGALTVTLADGDVTGQTKMIVMTVAANASTVALAHSDWGDAVLLRFAAVDDFALLKWNGTEWVVTSRSCEAYQLLTGTCTVSDSDIPGWMDSNAAAVTATLGSGSYTGQLKMIVMQEASNSSTLSITNHVTSDPEVATFDAVDEYGLFIWTGTEWATVANSCTFV